MMNFLNKEESGIGKLQLHDGIIDFLVQARKG
jgi:hypothetical protein